MKILNCNDKIKTINKQLLPNQELKITENGRFLIYNKQTGVIELLGCSLCALEKINQNEMGYPQINNQSLLSALNMPELDKNISVTIKNNLWFCPICRKVITQLLPEFI